MSLHLVLDGLALGAAGAAALTDVKSGRIPNRLTFPVALGAIVLHAVLGGWHRAGASLAGLLVAGLVPWVLYRFTAGRAIGGGDVKLFAALGALRGGLEGLEIELSACVLLATFALVRLALAGRLLTVLANVAMLLVGPFLPRSRRRSIAPEALTEMRMGPAILGAVAYVCLMDRAPGWVSWLA